MTSLRQHSIVNLYLSRGDVVGGNPSLSRKHRLWSSELLHSSSLPLYSTQKGKTHSFNSHLEPQQGHMPRMGCWQTACLGFGHAQFKPQSGWQSLLEGSTTAHRPLGLLTDSWLHHPIFDVGLLHKGRAWPVSIALVDFLCYRFCTLFHHSKAKWYPAFGTTPTE